MDDGWIPAEKTQHREEHQDGDKHDGAKKKPLACRDRPHISSSHHPALVGVDCAVSQLISDRHYLSRHILSIPNEMQSGLVTLVARKVGFRFRVVGRASAIEVRIPKGLPDLLNPSGMPFELL